MRLTLSALAAALLLGGPAGVAHADFRVHYKVNGLKMPAPEVSSAGSSCRDLKAKQPDAASGVYPITVAGNTFDVYCDMVSAGGGWTMVVAQLDTDPVTNWDEGIQPDYDPSLATRRGFALNSGQLPAHTEVALGREFEATYVEFWKMSYTTGDINEVTVQGLKSGYSYQVDRAVDHYHTNHDPVNPRTTSPGWNNTLTLDRVGANPYDWGFSPNHTQAAMRGFGMKGLKTSTIEPYAWTVWVR